MAILLSVCCTKVLETPHYGFYEEHDILKTEVDANALLNGAYSVMVRQNWQLFHNAYWCAIDFDNDHLVGKPAVLGAIASGEFQEYWGTSRIWDGLYKVISRCNQVLEKVPGMTIDEVVKNNVLGEARTLRAWAYFSLVRMYGELPLRIKSLETDPAVNVPRSPVSHVYKLIVEDLTTAIPKLLPKGDPKGGGIGRLNKPAAQAILAKVYLTMASGNQKGVSISVQGGRGADNTVKKYTQNGVAGYERFSSEEYFRKSLETSAAIINGTRGGAFDLAPYPELFTKAQIDGAEALWYLQFKTGTDVVNNLGLWYNPPSAKIGYGGGAWISRNFYDSYEETDYRVLKGILHQFIANGVPYYYPRRDSAKYTYMYNGMNAKYSSSAYLIKYADLSNPDLEDGDSPFFMERFANVLLMFAEAENEVNGPTAIAYHSINRVRKRSHASEAPIGMNKEDFRSFVFEERAKELTQECTRKFDLLRRGIYLQVLNNIEVDQENNIKSRTEKGLLYPIPQQDIDAGDGLLFQNPGW